MATPSLRPSNSTPMTYCRSSRARSNPPCTASSSGNGSRSKSAPRKTIVGPSSTASHRRDEGNWPLRPAGGTSSREPSLGFSDRRRRGPNHDAPQAPVARTRPGYSRPHRARNTGQYRPRHFARRRALSSASEIRQHNSDQGRHTGGVGLHLAGGALARHPLWLPHAPQLSRFHGCRDPYVGARHRSQHRDFQPDQCRDAAFTSGREPVAARRS